MFWSLKMLIGWIKALVKHFGLSLEAIAKSVQLRLSCILGYWWECYAYIWWFYELLVYLRYYWTELIVGWLKVELLRNLRSLWSVLCEEGAWVVITAIVWIARPCVAYWVNFAELCFEVRKCTSCEPPFSLNMLRDIKWIVFKIQRCLRRIVKCMFSWFRMLLSTYQLSGSLWKCL